MQSVSVGGALLTVGGVAGYVVGITAPYPGRAFSLTALMVGLTLVAVGRAGDGEDER
ncbi:hypothetical protein [Haloarcula litorea]|uniref:hypothetical protein n=1 Tax=Haloarcula litorea TaxID=3032579 RepID=UPI0023E757AB|nr:hypothetical protein [Halomicroarcula sp. GDY20]